MSFEMVKCDICYMSWSDSECFIASNPIYPTRSYWVCPNCRLRSVIMKEREDDGGNFVLTKLGVKEVQKLVKDKLHGLLKDIELLDKTLLKMKVRG